MPKINQEKKTYANSYDDVLKACQSAITKIHCDIIETKGNYFHVTVGFLPYIFGYKIEIYLLELPDKRIEVGISAKTGTLLFGHPEKVIDNIFKKIDSILDYQKWQKSIYSQSVKGEK